MKKAQIRAILDRVLTWPPERQDEAARVLTEMEAQDGSDLQLSEAQIAEVERRLAETDPKFLTLEEPETADRVIAVFHGARNR